MSFRVNQSTSSCLTQYIFEIILLSTKPLVNDNFRYGDIMKVKN